MCIKMVAILVLICNGFRTFYSILAMIGHVFLMLDGEDTSQISATGVSIIFIGGFIGKVIS